MSKIFKKHACFYIDTITFCVEDCLFKVPREPFEKESVVFGDMFLLPTGNLRKEGKSDTNPIRLIGIKKDEFEQLLSVLLHRTNGICQISLPETDDQWTSVLKLAVLWEFDIIRQVAIDHLKDRLSPVCKIALGNMFDLDFESWSLPAMHKLVRRQQPISLEEGQRMGLDITLKLASVREQVSFRLRHGSYQVQELIPGRRPNVEALDFTQFLRETFKASSN